MQLSGISFLPFRRKASRQSHSLLARQFCASSFFPFPFSLRSSGSASMITASPRIANTSISSKTAYLTDTFWSIIIAQNGVLGFACFIIGLFLILRSAIVRARNLNVLLPVLCIIVYLLICSTSETSFSIRIPSTSQSC